ncbi:uncharacterized protein [Procambarus clarkii]|uniref:uncharacterized protein n=1 Tax=Procambarus clarkii TaxID=6728 RepID=UPI003744043C
MLRVAGARGGRDSQEVDQVIKDVTEYIEGLREKIREPLDPADNTHLDQLHKEIKLFKAQIIEEVKQNSKQELTDGYRQLYQIEPAPWLLLNIKHDPSDTFTRLQLVQDSAIGVRPSHTPKVQDIKYEDLLTITREDGRLPQCVLLTGEGGMGKTTLLKLILEKWVRDPLAIHHLDTADLVFYVLCRDRHLNTIDDLINNLLPQTLLHSDVDFQMFKEIILSLNILVLIDGYDEVNENSEKLLKELLPLPGTNVKLVITTRPGWDQDLSLLIPSNKTRYNILVLGISPQLRLEYVNRIINALETDKSKQKATEDRFTQRLEKMSELLGDYLNTPLTLTLLALLCVETPEDFKKLTTSTEVYEQIHNFITDKLISRLKIKQVEDPEDKCDEFLLFFEEISLRGIVRKEFDLQPDTVKEIKLKCKALKLPHEEVLSNYFTRTSSRRGLKLVWVYGYFHSRYQEYCASKALLAQLLKADKERGGQPARSHYIDGWRKPNLLHDVMLEGEGKTHDGVISNHAKYQNVLINITGVMIARKLEHKFASQVTDMAKPEDEVLKHIVESHMNEHIIEAVVKELSDQKHWDIKNANSCDVLPLVLNKMTLKPRSLSIVINSKPQLSQISPLMSVLVKRKIILSLFLFYHHNENDEFSDVYLETLTAPGSECILQEFAGHLSEKAIPSLPDSIVSLYLRVTLQKLPILLDHMPHLPHINNISGGWTVLLCLHCLLSPTNESRRYIAVFITSTNESRRYIPVFITSTNESRRYIPVFITSTNESRRYIPVFITSTNESRRYIPVFITSTNESRRYIPVLSCPPMRAGDTSQCLSCPPMRAGDTSQCLSCPPMRAGDTSQCLSCPLMRAGDTSQCLSRPPMRAGDTSQCLSCPLMRAGDTSQCLSCPPMRAGDTSQCLSCPLMRAGDTSQCLSRPPMRAGDTSQCLSCPLMRAGDTSQCLLCPPIRVGDTSQCLSCPPMRTEDTS